MVFEIYGAPVGCASIPTQNVKFRTVRMYTASAKLSRVITLHNDLVTRSSREANQRQVEDTRETHLIP